MHVNYAAALSVKRAYAQQGHPPAKSDLNEFTIDFTPSLAVTSPMPAQDALLRK